VNTTEFLNIAVTICPDKIAIIYEDERFTFRQLNDRVNRLANSLRKLGVCKGDRVAMLEVNSSHCIEAYFAAAKLGAIYVPLNFRAKKPELKYILSNSGASILLVGDRYRGMAEEVVNTIRSVKYLILCDNKRSDMLYYEDIIVAGSPDEVVAEINDDDATILMYTAGTTGTPKGVLLPHRSFSVYVLDNVTPADQDTVEKNILTVPLYHIAGIQAMIAAIYGGRTLVIEKQFEPVE